MPAFEFPKPLLLAGQHLGPLDLAVDEVQCASDDDRDLLGHVLHIADQVAVLAPARTTAPSRRSTQPRAARACPSAAVGRCNAELQLLAVVQDDFRPGDGRLLLLEVRRDFVLEVIEDGFDVLAGAERVGLEVGAGAGVVADIEPADVTSYCPPDSGLVTR